MALKTSPATGVSNPTDVSWMCVLCCGWFAAFFVYFSYVPLWHTDIWGHVAYGQWILDHGQLPEFDPFVELARTTPLVATAWLSQIFFGMLERSGGPERLSCAYAVVSVSIYAVLACLFLLRTGRPGLALLCSILALLIGWNRHLVIRPELLGTLLLAVLLTLLTAARLTGFDHRCSDTSQKGLSTSGRWSVRGSVALLFGLWANIHGSFAVGLAVVAILVVGAIVDCGLNSRSILQFFTQAASRESLVLLVIAAATTLINPYGIGLLAYVFTFGTDPNIASISEWQSPGMLSVTGLAVAGATALFLATLRFRQRRATPSEVLMLCVFTAAVCMRERMVTWYAPVAVLLIAPNLHGIVIRFEQQPWAMKFKERLARRSRVQTALIGFLVWITFCFTPISQPVLGGQPRSGDQLFRNRTPRGIAEYLRDSAPVGRIANPQWWGDWLVWAGPPGLRVMMTTTSLHLVPTAHFKNYTTISWAHAGIENCLDEYDIQLIVIDRSLQTDLTEYAMQSPEWQIDYEDSQGLVALRRPAADHVTIVLSDR